MVSRAGVPVFAVALALGVALPAAAAGGGDPTLLIVKSAKQSVRATPGYHCLPDADGTGGSCEGDFPPLHPTGTVRITSRGRLTLLLGAPATYVRWRLSRRVGATDHYLVEDDAAKASKSGRRWRVQLPRRLRRANIIGFVAQFDNASCLWQVRAKVARS